MINHRVTKSSDSFGLIMAVVIILVVGVIGLGGWYVFQNNRTKPSSAANNTTENTNTPASNEPQPTVGYLEIQELGVRLRLVDSTSDAYYKVSEKASKTGKPNVYLSTRSLDSYEGCVASETSHGVAILSTFTEGYEDEVKGKFSRAYPDAPKINDLYYYIEGNQYDCTEVKDEELYNSVRRAFIDSYTTVERIPNGQQ